MKKHLLQIGFIGMLAMIPCFSTAQMVTNLYHTNRVFKPIEFTNMGSSITAYEAYTMIDRLTTVVGPTNIVTNAIWATEYEGLSWCLPSAESAWACVLSKYPYTTKCTSNHIYENAGWVKGTKSLDGEWGGFLWLQQNIIDFLTSETNIWVSPDGITNRIVKVLVGSIGDYPPMTNVVDIGPADGANITNCPGAGISTEAVFRADFTTYYQVINPLLVPDYDHNRVIDGRDRSKAVQNEVFHFWKNDDDDAGDLEGNDIPGDGTADSSDLAVDGTRDLVDWFSVYLDIKPTLEAFNGLGYKYVLATLETNEFNVIFSELKPWESGKYLTDLSNANATVSAAIHTINSNGYQLTTAFLDGIENDNKGVVLVEGRYSTTQPLQLRILDATNGVVLARDMPLRVSGVEEMSRYLNLRSVCGDTSGGASHTGEPSNYPDSLCGDKHVVFIHGFNESADSARGNIAETFKRLYWSGSKAKFTGVAWRGDQGFPAATHYHWDVTNAFATAPALAQYLSTLQGEVNVIAYSLGNMVVSSSIQDHGASPTRYFMLHAAVPMEAYDVSEYTTNMIENSWFNYTNRLYASEWHSLWAADPADGRYDLTWRGRFANAIGSQVCNFYSTEDDVLDNCVAQFTPLQTILNHIYHRTYNFRRYAWSCQELYKGRYANWLGGSTYGGWGFTDNHAYYNATTDEYQNVTWTLWDTTMANQQVTNMDLKTTPFFNSSTPVPSLFVDPTNSLGSGSVFAIANQDRMLAEMIPALSFAMGRNSLDTLIDPSGNRNFDMNSMKPNGFPQARFDNSRPVDKYPWLHGDYRAVAYLYTYSVFDKIVNDIGGFNQ